MEVHQIITGALNSGESSFAVGSVEGVNFTACAVGCDIVILTSEFQRVQIIPGLPSGNVQVTCTDCCSETGKIAAAYGDVIRIYEPSPLVQRTSNHKLDYQWFETASFSCGSQVLNLSWNLEGLRLLANTDSELQLWQHHWLTENFYCEPESVVDAVENIRENKQNNALGSGASVRFGIADDECEPSANSAGTLWDCVWHKRLASAINFVKFSPDGLLFATAGSEDRHVKVWFEDNTDTEAGVVNFSFTYLAHPEAVVGFEWRKTGRYMPRHGVANVLITWCRDNVCRIWCQTVLPESGSMIMDIQEAYGEGSSMGSLSSLNNVASAATTAAPRKGKSKLKHQRSRLMHRLKHLRQLKNKRRSKDMSNLNVTATTQEGLACTPDVLTYPNRHVLLPGGQQELGLPTLCHFHIAASISAESDCYLVPSMATHASGSNLVFTVHWLNNKELMFSMCAEKLLAEALLLGEQKDHYELATAASPSTAALAEMGLTVQDGAGGEKSPALRPQQLLVGNGTDQEYFGSVAALDSVPGSFTVPATVSSESSTAASTPQRDCWEVRMEALVRDWYHASDVLFSIHPVDGSLLVWTLEWLDEVCRQPQISFSSRLPHAFALTDAVSLHPNLAAFNPHDPVFVDMLHKSPDKPGDVQDIPLQPRNAIFLLTSHNNGSLNLWHLSMDEKSKFTTILNLSHKSRMCGHRFRINDVSCHPVLPLLLTTSYHNVKQNRGESQLHVGVPSERTSNELTCFHSELILWKVDSVGPLCKSGGVRELARINSPDYSAFSSVAWIPSVLPSSTLGSVCNSPSSCFVASDGRCLRVYQAVIDARALLAQLSGSRMHENLSRSTSTSSQASSPDVDGISSDVTFNVASSQSTARPGCVLDLGAVCDSFQDWKNVLLLHVFQEQLLCIPTSGEMTPAMNSCYFREVFYLIAVEKNKDRSQKNVLHMWKIELLSHLLSSDHDGCEESVPNEHSDKYERKPRGDKLHINSTKVCTQPLPLPNGVMIMHASPAAGHLSSTSIYPACAAPYLFSTACSDDNIRFWQCAIGATESGEQTCEWREWSMDAGGVQRSALEVDGRPLSISCAYSARFACAVDPSNTFDTRTQDTVSIQVAVYECESSGGTEWTQEDVINLRNIRIPRHVVVAVDVGHTVHSPVDDLVATLEFSGGNSMIRRSSSGANLLPKIPSTPSFATYTDMRRAVTEHQLRCEHELTPQKQVVRLDWVSTEDGSYILTVGVGPKIFLYAPFTEDVAQQNLVIMKESESRKKPVLRKMSSIAAPPVTRKLVRWVNLKTIELHSADSRPPLPMMLGWVRDGILVVGMETEMRVYSQWNAQKEESRTAWMDADTAQPVDKADMLPQKFLSVAQTVHLTISPSHSVLDLTKKGKDPASMKRVTKRPPLPGADDRSQAGSTVIDIVQDEGLFEAARMCSPVLPQYHPKQLMELLNAGRVRRVKAVLLHVLRTIQERQFTSAAFSSRHSSVRQSASDDEDGRLRARSLSKTKSDMHASLFGEELTLDYQEIDSIPPLPLYALLAADHEQPAATGALTGDADGGEAGSPVHYNQLFSGPRSSTDEPLDIDFDDDDDKPSRRRRASVIDMHTVSAFGAKHSRLLTSILTHVHLPGLSSVDQMHLLAVADTISSFTPDVMDKLTQLNAAYSRKGNQAVIEMTAGGGYASVGAGTDAVDECGLRFLMALKQHEYLLRCLPLKQRTQLRNAGVATASLIWAFHSETETELLNSIPALQSNASWSQLKSVGAGWWLHNVSTLKLCIEKIAKTAFQAQQDPMDAALYYMALRKKNILWGLFRSTQNTLMTDFFARDFSEDKWRRAALKNAFVLMGKQRFEHAIAFFLLGNSLTDALQVCLSNLNDLQLALVLVKLYETDPDAQNKVIKQLLCQQVFACSPDELADLERLPPSANRDPFTRSMAFWLLKEYSRALSTLLDEDDGTVDGADQSQPLSDVFNFYTFLRTHPFVLRQRLHNAGVSVGSTDKFLQVSKRLSEQVTPQERRLYFRTACRHFKAGCALLALEVMSKLPKRCVSLAAGASMDAVMERRLSSDSTDVRPVAANQPPPATATLDWGASLLGSDVAQDEPKLELEWSSEEDDDAKEREDNDTKKREPEAAAKAVSPVEQQPLDNILDERDAAQVPPIDIMAQQLKFMACLKIMMEELATLASGFEVEGGQLRYQLYCWLEREVGVLKELCDYTVAGGGTVDDDVTMDGGADVVSPAHGPLHEVLRTDRTAMEARIKRARRRRRWLASHQSLLRTLVSYCSLHASQGVGLASARMELLLLLQELHQEPLPWSQLAKPLPVTMTFPLLSASVASYKTDIADPIRYLQGQTADLMQTLADLGSEPPQVEHNMAKVYLLYNMAQCLSACIYESLCDIENIVVPKGAQMAGMGHLIRHRHKSSTASSLDDDDSPAEIVTEPSKWPGVKSLITLLSRERDEEAPNLKLLLAEAWVAIYLSLFTYALVAYDSRWLFRLMGHSINADMFAQVFGGGGERRIIIEASKVNPTTKQQGGTRPAPVQPSLSVEKQSTVDSGTLRNKLHARVFGPPRERSVDADRMGAGSVGGDAGAQQLVTTREQWIQPRFSVAAYFTGKPSLNAEALGFDYDSEDASDDESDGGEQPALEDEKPTGGKAPEVSQPQHSDPNSYAWAILRLACVRHAARHVTQFLAICGFELSELPGISPLLHQAQKSLEITCEHCVARVEAYPGGCPAGFLPNSDVESTSFNGPAIQKYRTIVDEKNTPFRERGKSAKPVKRLWLYLVRQEHLFDVFVRYIFKMPQEQGVDDTRAGVSRHLPEPLKIVQREQDPISAFAVSQSNFGWIVVSTGREVQEMDISPALQARLDWMYDQTELDLALHSLRRSPLKDNDDYVLLQSGNVSEVGSSTPTAAEKREAAVVSSRGASFHLTPFLVDRSRHGLRKVRQQSVTKLEHVFGESLPPVIALPYLCKRDVHGVKRMEAHPSLPYYLSGASDGSVRMWEWGVAHPLYTPRAAGQFAKVTRVQFSPYGNKFGITDHDGSLCLWQVSHGMTLGKPFLNIKCHSKSAADFAFVSGSSSLIATAGHSTSDVNVALWDTLLPTDRALVQSWPCHPEGATSVVYVPQHQALYSGGRHGELCIFDVRQRVLRQTIKAFEHAAVKSMALDPGGGEFVATGSADGDIKIWSLGVPQLLYAFPAEHSAKAGFSLRHVGAGTIQGVAQLYVDAQQRLYSCGADCSLKLRPLPSLYQDFRAL